MSDTFENLEAFVSSSFPSYLPAKSPKAENAEKARAEVQTTYDENLPLILLISEDVNTLEILTSSLNSKFKFLTASSLSNGIALFHISSPNLVVCDANLNIENFLNIMSQTAHTVPVLALTSPSSRRKNISLLGKGVCDLVITPFEAPELESKIQTHLENHQVRKVLENEITDISSVSLEDLARDISEKLREMRKLNRLKDEFLAVLSHELRNPINVISGFSEILLTDYELPESAHKAVEAIFRNVQIQNKLVTDILDISRSSTGKFYLECKPIDLESVTKEIWPSIQAAAAKKDLHLELKCETLGTLINGDSIRLSQVIWNLLSNAIKFTPSEGKITVELKYRNQWIELSVQDTGIGIEPDGLSQIFEKFHQQDPTISRNFGGLGLGLAIVRHIVEMHGGSVRAESAGLGKGARFTVSFPVLAN